MLNIFYELGPFFEDSYRRISVREYARIIKVSPPSASKILAKYSKEGLLIKEEERRYIFYYTNKQSQTFIDLSRIYLLNKLNDLILYLKSELISPTIVLFGSFSKAEISKNSDIDIAIFTKSKRKINLDNFEKKLNRKIQTFVFENLEKVKNKDLLHNILNGYILGEGF